jgi:glutamine synthetase
VGLAKDDIIRAALGRNIYERFVEAKRGAWQDYIGKVSEWELERYLSVY